MRSVFRLAILAAVTGTPYFSTQVAAPTHVISSTRRTNSAERVTGIEVAVVPELPFIEKGQGQQLVNFDLLLKNSGPESYNLVAIRLSVFDSSGHLELKRELNKNGSPPALDMIAERTLHQGEVTDVFQPFFAFGPEIDLSRMHLELLFVQSGDRVQPVAMTADEKISVDVRPRSYSPAAFCLPLRALTLVHDGHDFYSHHRRYNLVDRYKTNPNSAVSANLYAFDFMRVTAAGAFLKGDGNQKQNWLTYGEPVLAPADGLVIEAVSDLPENSFSKTGEVQNPAVLAVRDPMGFGNHVKLQHADGRVSWLLHMETNSVTVKIGNRVRAGQLLGKVGFSGDSLFPHLHYNVTNGPEYPSQGVPVYFKQFVQVLGERRRTVSSGDIDTGNFIQEAEGSCR